MYVAVLEVYVEQADLEVYVVRYTEVITHTSTSLPDRGGSETH